jgi:phage antirepressor YoqD-like protein
MITEKRYKIEIGKCFTKCKFFNDGTMIGSAAIKLKIEKSGRNDLANVVELSGVMTELEALLLQKKLDKWKDDKIEKLQGENEILKPKALVYDSFIAGTCLSIGDYAKLFHTRENKLGRNKLFQLLRENKILMNNNVPYQEYKHFFDVKITPLQIGDHIQNIITTLITPAGVDYIAKRFNFTKQEV